MTLGSPFGLAAGGGVRHSPSRQPAPKVFFCYLLSESEFLRLFCDFCAILGVFWRVKTMKISIVVTCFLMFSPMFALISLENNKKIQALVKINVFYPEHRV